jgi:hypothetical protein
MVQVRAEFYQSMYPLEEVNRRINEEEMDRLSVFFRPGSESDWINEIDALCFVREVDLIEIYFKDIIAECIMSKPQAIMSLAQNVIDSQKLAFEIIFNSSDIDIAKRKYISEVINKISFRGFASLFEISKKMGLASNVPEAFVSYVLELIDLRNSIVHRVSALKSPYLDTSESSRLIKKLRSEAPSSLFSVELIELIDNTAMKKFGIGAKIYPR